MNQEQRKILAANRVYLKNNLLVSADMLSYLRDDKIITEEHEEILMKGHQTRISRTNFLVDLIVKRGPKAFESFLKSLILSDQTFVAEHLHKTLTEKILNDLRTLDGNIREEEDFSDPKLIKSLKSRFKDLDIKDPAVVESLKELLKDYPEECGMPILKSLLQRIDFNDPNVLECFKPLLKDLALNKDSLRGISTSSLLKRTNFQFDPKVLACLGPLVEAALKEAPSRAAEANNSDEELKDPDDKLSRGQPEPLLPSAPSAASLLLKEFSKGGDTPLEPTAPPLPDELSETEIKPALLASETPAAEPELELPEPPSHKLDEKGEGEEEDEDEPDKKGSFRNCKSPILETAA